MVATRRSINHIHYLSDATGNRIETQQGYQDHCIDYFSNLLGGNVEPFLFEQSDLELLLLFRSSMDQKGNLSKMFSKKEIKSAFFSLPRNKTCGPDGYSSEFFITCWEIMGQEVSKAVIEFFEYGRILHQWNTTTLVLIPKIPNDSATIDFRPISCLNTVYKIILKLLANRLKAILPEVIIHSQSASCLVDY